MQDMSSDLRQNNILQYASPPPTHVTILTVFVRHCDNDTYQVVDNQKEQCTVAALQSATPFYMHKGVIMIVAGSTLIVICCTILYCVFKQSRTIKTLESPTAMTYDSRLVDANPVQTVQSVSSREGGFQTIATGLRTTAKDGSVTFGTADSYPEPWGLPTYFHQPTSRPRGFDGNSL
ncbi:hypothetical protein BVRB_031650 [Beta vulgaris subsp. vulgaris]|uniref:Uncharacterized protein n=1 Tax=Beta vulgaris subsp. vulgaris TaxID=3555 RepID=A0A0J8AXD6_BETVV|nr:hypothetical protein BVRB_031650 [Beta vulgaris subsp. vulgaris]